MKPADLDAQFSFATADEQKTITVLLVNSNRLDKDETYKSVKN